MGPDFRATFHKYSFVPGRQTDGLLSQDERSFPYFHKTLFYVSILAYAFTCP